MSNVMGEDWKSVACASSGCVSAEDVLLLTRLRQCLVTSAPSSLSTPSSTGDGREQTQFSDLGYLDIYKVVITYILSSTYIVTIELSRILINYLRSNLYSSYIFDPITAAFEDDCPRGTS